MVAVVWLAFHYLCVLVQESVRYWWVYLLLCLPPRFFSHKEMCLETDGDAPRFIWIARVRLALGPVFEMISGQQLMLLADREGRIPFNALQTYYPTLRALDICYMESTPRLASFDEMRLIVLPIDIQKRVNVHTGRKCKFGRIQL